MYLKQRVDGGEIGITIQCLPGLPSFTVGGVRISHDLNLYVVDTYILIDWLCFEFIMVVFDDADGFCWR